MTKKLQNILRGIGSVMDIAPSTYYGQFVPKENSQERMYGHWVRIGFNIQNSTRRFANEKKIQK